MGETVVNSAAVDAGTRIILINARRYMDSLRADADKEFADWDHTERPAPKTTGVVKPEMSLTELYENRFDAEALNQFSDNFMRQIVDAANDDLGNLTEEQSHGFNCLAEIQIVYGEDATAINMYVDMVEQLRTNLKSFIAPEWVEENLESEDQDNE